MFFCGCDIFVFCSLFFFFNDTATTEIYTLSLHDALPICPATAPAASPAHHGHDSHVRSEEHTSELQSRSDLVCRLLLEKKKKTSLKSPHKKEKQKKTKQHETTKTN